MTATPIPRTLALSLYGDLDLSVLDELPPGRTPIVTRRVSGERSEEVWEFVRKQVALKRQAYIVYPVIEGTMDDQPELDFSHDPEAEIEPPERGRPLKGQDCGPLSESCPGSESRRKSGLKSPWRCTRSCARDRWPACVWGCCMGARRDEKEIVMRRFQRGEIDVLVATTVIEVG